MKTASFRRVVGGLVVLAALTLAFASGANAAPPVRPDPSPGAAVATPHQGSQHATYVAPKAAASSTDSASHRWSSPLNGTWRLTLTGLPVSKGQAVVVSASECDASGNEWLGDAPFDVQNVVVGDGWVAVRVVIQWKSPLGLCLHYVW